MGEVVLSIGGKRHTGWTGLRIRRALDALTGSFDLSLARREQTEALAPDIAAGAAVELLIAGERVITGWIDRIGSRRDAEADEITVSGRDKAADLVDASAIATPGSWRMAAMPAIVAQLLQPFGVTATFTGDAGGPIRRFALQQGETVAQAIERLCRFRGLTSWSRPDGSIEIGNPAEGPVVARLVEGTHDVLSWSIEHDISDRFSEYVVKGQAAGDDTASGRAVARVKGAATDPGVRRYRPLILVAEEQADGASAEKRAEWEANVRAGRSQTASVVVPGWQNPSGQLWRPADRVELVAPSIRVDSTMLIVSAELARTNEQGTVTVLELQPPSAWQQLPVSETDATAVGGRR